MQKFGRDDVENLVAEGKFEITLGWEDKNLDITSEEICKTLQERLGKLLLLADESLELAGFGTMQRMQPGVELKSHTDQHTDPSIRYAAILYINDDYDGGVLEFKHKDYVVKPEPGMLVNVPLYPEFEHRVTKVRNGTRHTLYGRSWHDVENRHVSTNDDC